MNVTNFIVENEFLKKYGFLSSYTLSDGHGINPAWVEENSKNTELIFIDAVSNSNEELIIEYICKLNSGVFMYFKFERQTANYKLKLFFEPNNRNEVKFLINKLIRNKNGNNPSDRK